MERYLLLDSLETDLSQYPDKFFSGLFVSGSLDSNNFDLTNLPQVPIFLINGNLITDQAGIQIGKIIQINNPDDMKTALEDEKNDNLKYLIIETGDWHIIPLENLIAKYDHDQLKLIVKANTLTEYNLLSNILEKGVDGVLINNDNQLITSIQEQEGDLQPLNLIEISVASIEKIREGERVCVDTCSLLQAGEGLLVGSTSTIFTLIEAEVHESGFVNSRPFRVNAGVVASYFLNGEKTGYLSELGAGKTVMIINREGRARKEVVARIKVERRPLVLVKVNWENKDYPIILQDAETVRLVGVEGSIPVTQLKVGDKILAYHSGHGRHFGMKVDEFLEER